MELAGLLKALGDPTRLQIFCLLLERKHCVHSLSMQTGISESAVSQHLKALREAGLVYGERCGHHVHYFPKQETMNYLASAFEAMRGSSLALDRDLRVCRCEYGFRSI